MKSYLLLFLILTSYTLQSQVDTEVYLLDLKNDFSKWSLSNMRNVSNNADYDNQPNFYNDNILVFASTRYGQTDIGAYHIKDNTLSYINSTPEGSEYSPTKIPGQKAVSAIRLDTTGLQRLYSYDYESGNNRALLANVVVGYHTWVNDHTIASFVLGNPNTLVISDLKEDTNTTIDSMIGRSLHRLPNTINTFSYISKSKSEWLIKSFNLDTSESRIIVKTLPDAEDMCWLINGTILMPKGNTIYKFNPKTDETWSVFKTFDDANLQNITRIATNETSSLLALVSEVSPEVIVQKQLDAYNAHDIAAFLATYTDDIELYQFPNQLIGKGKKTMRQQYGNMFSTIPDLNAEILNRTIIGNKVIDKEKVTLNGRIVYAVAIYEVENGLISKVTFVR